MHKWTKAAIGVCLALSALRFSQSQDRKTSDDSFFRSSRNGHTKPPIRTEGIGDDLPPSSKPEVADAAIFEDTLDDPRQRLRQIQLAAQKLRSPDSTEKERADARSLVAEGLREEFDADLSRRVEKLTQLEKQLEQLKAHVQKRREARDQLVQMQVQLLENEATGLAFPAEWQVYLGPQTEFPGDFNRKGPITLHPNVFDSLGDRDETAPFGPDAMPTPRRRGRRGNDDDGYADPPAARPDEIGRAVESETSVDSKVSQPTRERDSLP